MGRNHDDVRERGHLVGLWVGDSHPVHGRDQVIELGDRRGGIAGVHADVGTERRVGRLLVRAANGHARVVVGARGHVVAQERVGMSELHEQHAALRIELVPSRVFVPRFLEIALCPVGIADEEVRVGLIRGQRLGVLHVRERLGEVARLTEDVIVPDGSVGRVHLGRDRQRLRDRGTRVCVLVQCNLGSGERQPGARAVGILLHQLLSKGELTLQVVVIALADHLDLEPLGLRCARGVLLRQRQVGLELVERVRGVGDVHVREREIRVRGDRRLEVRVRVDEPAEIELALAFEVLVPCRRRGRGNRMLDQVACDGIQGGSPVLCGYACVPGAAREHDRQRRTRGRVADT